MKKFFTLIAATLFAVGLNAEEIDLTANFNYTWNGEESIVNNADGSITFNAQTWGGLAAYFATSTEDGQEVPVDWSGYSKIVFEFAEATTVNTQILVLEGASAWGNIGITSLECSFAGNDMTGVKQVALQAAEPTTITIKRIYLVTKDGDDPVIDPNTKPFEYKSMGGYDATQDAFVFAAGSAGWYSRWIGTMDVTDWNTLVIEVENTNGDVQFVAQGDKADDSMDHMMILKSAAPQKYYFDLTGWTNLSQVAFQNFNFTDPDIEDWDAKQATAQETTMKVSAMYLSKENAPAEQVTVSRIIFSEAAAKGSLNGRQFVSDDALLMLTITDTDESKLEIDANSAYFGTAEAYEVYDFRLKSGGKSSSKNALTLSVAAEGTLKVCARTGSNSAEDRNVVLTQNGETLYDNVVKEADAVEVTIGENTKKVYPVIAVPVVAGSVEIAYPVNSINFYAFLLETKGATNGIEEQVKTVTVDRNGIYNLRGQRVDATYRGLVIMNGKKYFQK